MAIKGVSDIRRLPRLGKIRLGEKALAQSGKEYPKAVDYFICPPEVQKVYGEKPRVLDIMFPVDDPNVFFSQWYKRYGKTTGLLCKGDGETAITYIDPETGEKLADDEGKMVEIECTPEECEWYRLKHCRRLANLQFLLPKVPGLGVFQIDTTSFYSIININSALDMIRAVAGRVHMLPLQLVLKPQEVTPDGRKKTVYIMDLVAPVTLSKLIAAGQTSPAKLLMPALDENERPDDLYPDAVLNKEETEPFNLNAQPEKEQPKAAPPAQETPPATTRRRSSKAQQPAASTQPQNGNGGRLGKERMQQWPEEDNADGGFWDQAAGGGGQNSADCQVDAELHRLWDILGTPQAKRQAQLAKPNLDKKALLDTLNAEIDRRVADNDGRGTPPEPPPTPRASTPPPPPPQTPSTQPGLFF